MKIKKKNVLIFFSLDSNEILFETKEECIFDNDNEKMAFLRKNHDFENAVVGDEGMFLVWKDSFNDSLEFTFSFYSWERLLSSFRNKIISISLQKMKQKASYLAINYSNSLISVFKICNGIEKMIFSEQRKVVNLCIGSTGRKMVALNEDHDGFFVWEFSEDKLQNFDFIKFPNIENIRYLFQDEIVLTFDSIGMRF